ncbi:MAG: amidohydrolase family protein [Pseudomonadota bacterium]
MEADLKPALVFNDHLSMAMRSKCTPIQERAFEHSPEFAVMDLNDADLFAQCYRKHTERSGLDYEDHKTLVHQVWDRRSQVVETMRGVAAKARAKGIPMLSHDDTQAETRAFYHDLGATTSEFPMSMGPVEAAQKNGDMIIFGAPNAVRGGSDIGSLGAADMVEAGLCDMLASDYYYPPMLAAIDRLDRKKRADRSALWSLISSGSTRAMGLADRGEIKVGKRADLVLVDWPSGHTLAVQGTWVAGRCAYRAQCKN